MLKSSSSHFDPSNLSRQTIMSKFANVVTIEVAPGRRDQVVTLLLAHKARLKDEPGTLQFEVAGVTAMNTPTYDKSISSLRGVKKTDAAIDEWMKEIALQVQVGVGEATGTPVFLCDNLTHTEV
jgi:hypothetical protein